MFQRISHSSCVRLVWTLQRLGQAAWEAAGEYACYARE
jgi:hypothetical protein